MRPDDERNDLLTTACEIALRQRPRVFVLENVPGLASSLHRKRLEALLSRFSEAGYAVELAIIKCEEHGLAQRRRRLFVVARSGGKPFHLGLPHLRQMTLGEVFDRIKNPRADTATILNEGTGNRKVAENISAGQKLSDVRAGKSSVHTWQIPEVYGEINSDERNLLEQLMKLRRRNRLRAVGDGDAVSISQLSEVCGKSAKSLAKSLQEKGYVRNFGGRYELKHTFNGSFRRLDRTKPSPTVDTHFGSPRLFLHPSEHRGLSFIEAAALQGFPESFDWPEGKSRRFKLIGNAVPPPISRQIASMVRELM